MTIIFGSQDNEIKREKTRNISFNFWKSVFENDTNQFLKTINKIGKFFLAEKLKQETKLNITGVDAYSPVILQAIANVPSETSFFFSKQTVFHQLSYSNMKQKLHIHTGSHTMGKARCLSFRQRIYDEYYHRRGKTYWQILRSICPKLGKKRRHVRTAQFDDSSEVRQPLLH